MKNIIISALAAYIAAHMRIWICEPGEVMAWLFAAILAAVQCADWKIREWREGSEKNDGRKYSGAHHLQHRPGCRACGVHDNDRLCG